MGDMADMAIEQGIQRMSEEGFGADYDEGNYHSGIGNSIRFVTCRYCHTYLLRWERTDQGWRMINEAGELHSCEEYRKAKAKAYDPDPDRLQCPVCKEEFDRDFAALSRKDNTTLLCSACGTKEAFEEIC